MLSGPKYLCKQKIAIFPEQFLTFARVVVVQHQANSDKCTHVILREERAKNLSQITITTTVLDSKTKLQSLDLPLFLMD